MRRRVLSSPLLSLSSWSLLPTVSTLFSSSSSLYYLPAAASLSISLAHQQLYSPLTTAAAMTICSNSRLSATTTTTCEPSQNSHPLLPPLKHNPRFVYGKDDCLFGCIEELQGDRPFGRTLDAGTGLHSLRWIASLYGTTTNTTTPTTEEVEKCEINNNKSSAENGGRRRAGPKGLTEFTAVTADTSMQQKVQEEAKELGLTSEHGQVVVFNWFGDSNSNQQQQQRTNHHPLEGKVYDTILADYLIGAMDAFSPYQQDEIFSKLAAYLNPNGGRLYIVGLEPIPQSHPEKGPNLICRVKQVRDACILLAGHSCYREYPLSWAVRQIQRNPLLKLLNDNDDINDEDNCSKDDHGQNPTADTEKESHEEQSHSHSHSHSHQTSKKTSCYRFPILYRHFTIVKQINVARSKLPILRATLSSPALSAVANDMEKVLNELEEESLRLTNLEPSGRIQLGFDYVMAAEMRRPEQKQPTQQKE